MLRTGALGLLLLVALVVSGCAAGVSSPASGVTSTSATLNGNVFSALDGTVSYWFAYGRTAAYGKETTHRTMTVNDRNLHPISETVTGLNSGTPYHYQACAQYPGLNAICGDDQTFTTQGSVSQLSIAAQPALFPDFDPSVSDYVTRCGSAPVDMSVAAPAGTTVSINGQPGQSGVFDQNVQLSAGHSFSFSTTTGGQTSTYHVRCLPSDFPLWTYTRQGTPSAHFYIATPQNALTPSGQPAGRYVVIFDDNGVPVWWKAAPASDAKLLSDGNLEWYTTNANGTTTPGDEEHRLDGSLVHVWQTVNGITDIHDFQLLPNGDALMISYIPRPGTVDLSAYGGPSQNATVIDGEIEEVAPDGHLVWSWNSKDHISLNETGSRWWSVVPVSTLPDGRTAYDYAHMNSIEENGNTIVVSFRHLDAVYAINRSTGAIIYKLGGTTTPQSLTVLNDPDNPYPLGGQHYARVQPDGTLTLHDNNTFLNNPPRAARYQINLFNNTATLIDQVTDPEVPSSACCGSAQLLSDGSWLMSWGANPLITEFGSNGARHFELKFSPRAISYRVAPITGSSPTISDLRAGMDAMASQPQAALNVRPASPGVLSMNDLLGLSRVTNNGIHRPRHPRPSLHTRSRHRPAKVTCLTRLPARASARVGTRAGRRAAHLRARRTVAPRAGCRAPRHRDRTVKRRRTSASNGLRQPSTRKP